MFKKYCINIFFFTMNYLNFWVACVLVQIKWAVFYPIKGHGRILISWWFLFLFIYNFYYVLYIPKVLFNSEEKCVRQVVEVLNSEGNFFLMLSLNYPWILSFNLVNVIFRENVEISFSCFEHLRSSDTLRVE